MKLTVLGAGANIVLSTLEEYSRAIDYIIGNEK